MRACIALALLALTIPALADSPITSTPFSEAYSDYAIVRDAQESGVMTYTIAEYLAEEDSPLDVRAAVINGLSWDIDGKDNAESFCEKVLDDKNAPDPEDLRGDLAFVIGYLLVMDDYFEPERALPYLEAAKEELPESFTVAMVAALVTAQGADMNDPLSKLTDDVLYDTDLNGDMRLGAIRIITDYMDLYQ